MHSPVLGAQTFQSHGRRFESYTAHSLCFARHQACSESLRATRSGMNDRVRLQT